VEILLVVFINVLFLVGVYYSLSRKVARIDSRGLPKELEDEMSSIITSFNSTADRNIDLLDDRLRKLEPLAARAEKLSEQLDGLVRRAEAIAKLRELMQSGSTREGAAGTPPGGTEWPAIPPGEAPLAPPAVSPADGAQSLAGNRPEAHGNAALMAKQTEVTRPAREVARAYKTTQVVTAPIKPEGVGAASSLPSGANKKAARASEKKSPRKANSRRKKTPDEILREMSEAGDDASEIARVLSISREEVLLKQRLLRLKP
jgi:hypothetical protein